MKIIEPEIQRILTFSSSRKFEFMDTEFMVIRLQDQMRNPVANKYVLLTKYIYIEYGRILLAEFEMVWKMNLEL